MQSPNAMQIEMIGHVRCEVKERRHAPCQPSSQPGVLKRGFSGEVIIDARFEDALLDLESFSRIWLVYNFHLNSGYPLKVRPPRGGPKRGLFATRSPDRPSSIGLTSVRLLKRDGRVLHCDEMDLLDGTPILDIKPYIASVDAYPDANEGWLESQAWEPGREMK